MHIYGGITWFYIAVTGHTPALILLARNVLLFQVFLQKRVYCSYDTSL